MSKPSLPSLFYYRLTRLLVNAAAGRRRRLLGGFALADLVALPATSLVRGAAVARVQLLAPLPRAGLQPRLLALLQAVEVAGILTCPWTLTLKMKWVGCIQGH